MYILLIFKNLFYALLKEGCPLKFLEIKNTFSKFPCFISIKTSKNLFYFLTKNF